MVLAILLVIVLVILAFIAIDALASAAGGDARLWALCKVLVVIAAIAWIIERTGVLA